MGFISAGTTIIQHHRDAAFSDSDATKTDQSPTNITLTPMQFVSPSQPQSAPASLHKAAAAIKGLIVGLQR